MYLRPIVIDEHDEILGGNQRYLACKDLGWEDVPTIQADDLSAQQRNEFIIKDNYHAGDFDVKILASEWNAGDLMSWANIKIANNNGNHVEPDVDFFVELDEMSNYIVLVFKKDIDWVHVQSLLELQSGYAKSAKGKLHHKGVGRIVDGVLAIERIQKAAKVI